MIFLSMRRSERKASMKAKKLVSETYKNSWIKTGRRQASQLNSRWHSEPDLRKQDLVLVQGDLKEAGDFQRDCSTVQQD